MSATSESIAAGGAPAEPGPAASAGARRAPGDAHALADAGAGAASPWRMQRRPLGRAVLARALAVAGRVWLPAAIVVAWQLACSAGLVPATLLPAPIDIGETLVRLVESGDLWRHVRASGLRALTGFSIAATVALALGIGMGIFRRLDRVVDLLLQVLKPIPPIAWIPLSILWFGIDEGAKVFIIALGAFFPILTSTVDAIRQTDGRYVELAQVLELPRGLFIRRILIPGALPQIMSGLRLGLAMSWMCVVAAELIAASSGLGFLIMDGRAMSQADLVIAGMFAMGLLGKLTDDGLRLLEHRLIRWRPRFSGLGTP